ncbi:MAG: outer membrane beta-barrel protein [Desulfobacterales bacterium]|nr:outer membrane beta-barrel protein [Desulfobacterales bacterium]
MRRFSCDVRLGSYAILIVVGAIFFYKGAFAAVTFYPRLSVGNTYTDNIDLDPDDEKHDFITNVSPAIGIDMADRLNTLSLSYTPSYACYLRYPENDSWRHDADLSLTRQLTRTTRIEFSDSYMYTEEPLYDTEEPIYEADTTVRQGREPYYTNTASFNAINQFGPEDFIEFGYDYYFLRNRGPTVEDNEHHIPRVTINYWLLPSQIGTESEFSYTKRTYDDSENYNDVHGRIRIIRRFNPHFEIYAEYTHELTNYEAGGEDYQVYTPLVGFMWDEYANSSFSGSLGYFFQEGEESEDESGIVATIETDYTWPADTTVSLAGAAGCDRASSGAENLGFTEFYSMTGALEHPLSRRLNSRIAVDYRRNVYTELAEERTDTIWRVDSGLIYQALPWMNVAAYYVFRKVESDDDENEYVENRAEISITLNPRQPVMLSR